jgi:hypothetical protein
MRQRKSLEGIGAAPLPTPVSQRPETEQPYTVIAQLLLRMYYPVHIDASYSLNRVNNDQALDKTRESRSKSPCRELTTTLVARRGKFSKSCAAVRSPSLPSASASVKPTGSR